MNILYNSAFPSPDAGMWGMIARRRNVCLLIFLFILISVWALPIQGYASDYTIGEGDVLKITVYGHDDLNTVERVSAGGRITFPLIGQVMVSGMTVVEISNHVAQLLSDGYLISPQVNVFVQEFRSQKAVIMGEITKPGLYELKGRITFLELVSMAGGVTGEAGDRAIIKRKLDRQQREKVIEIDLDALIKQGDTSQDIPVMDGDSIYVSKAGLFYVTGEVKRPDAYKLKEHTTVIMAITMAGGLTDRAAERKVKIIRTIDGKEQLLLNVNMDETIIAGDVVVVPESFF